MHSVGTYRSSQSAGVQTHVFMSSLLSEFRSASSDFLQVPCSHSCASPKARWLIFWIHSLLDNNTNVNCNMQAWLVHPCDQASN